MASEKLHACKAFIAQIGPAVAAGRDDLAPDAPGKGSFGIGQELAAEGMAPGPRAPQTYGLAAEAGAQLAGQQTASRVAQQQLDHQADVMTRKGGPPMVRGAAYAVTERRKVRKISRPVCVCRQTPDEAATRIQRVFRGYATRRQLISHGQPVFLRSVMQQRQRGGNNAIRVGLQGHNHDIQGAVSS